MMLSVRQHIMYACRYKRGLRYPPVFMSRLICLRGDVSTEPEKPEADIID